MAGHWAEPLQELRSDLGLEIWRFYNERIGASSRGRRTSGGAVVGRDHKDDRRIMELLEASGCFGAVQMRQVQVHQHELRHQGSGGQNCLETVFGRADDVETALLSQDVSESMEHDWTVIDQEHRDGVWVHRVVSWRSGMQDRGSDSRSTAATFEIGIPCTGMNGSVVWACAAFQRRAWEMPTGSGARFVWRWQCGS